MRGSGNRPVQAIVKVRPGCGVEVRQVPEPTAGQGEVKVEVRAAAICGADLKVYKWEPQLVQQWSRLRQMELPHVIGHEVSGVVVETGKDVSGIEVGERVAAETHFPCGACFLCQSDRMHLCRDRRILGFDTPGGFARYVVLPQCCAVRLPDDVSFEAGALYEPFGVAVHAIERAGPLDVESAWVIGCGPIGLFIIKLLTVMGAGEIIATDTEPSRLRWAQKLGAVAAAAHDGICDQIVEMTGGHGAEVVFEAVGSSQTVQQALTAAAPRGRVLLVGTFGGQTPIDVAPLIVYREATVSGVYGRHMFDTWRAMKEVDSIRGIDLEQFVTHRHPFSEAREAFETALRGEGVKTILFPDEE